MQRTIIVTYRGNHEYTATVKGVESIKGSGKTFSEAFESIISTNQDFFGIKIQPLEYNIQEGSAP